MKIKLKNGYETDEYGVTWHYVDGDLHSVDDLPAVVLPNGSKRWYKCNILHRENNPACILHGPDGIQQEWFIDGKMHREDGPAAIRPYGEYYFKDGKLHREDGPAIRRDDGSLEWHLNGNYHRDGGPAIIDSDGNRFWYHHGKLHRLDGPASISLSFGIVWYIDGNKVKVKTQKEFINSQEYRSFNMRAFW